MERKSKKRFAKKKVFYCNFDKVLKKFRPRVDTSKILSTLRRCWEHPSTARRNIFKQRVALWPFKKEG